MRHAPFHGFMPWTMDLGCLLLLALGIALLVVWLANRRRNGFPKHKHHHGEGWHPGHPANGPQPPSAALQVLDERLARGDIDVDDYLTRRSALLGDRPNGTEYQPTTPPHPTPQQPAPPADAPRTDSPEGDSPAV